MRGQWNFGDRIAHLERINAALLEALERMVENEDDALHGRRLRHPHLATWNAARAAIAQAKGETA